MSYKPHPSVTRLLAEFEKLPEDQRQTVIGELAGFCYAYRKGFGIPEITPIHFLEDQSFEDCDGEPQVQSEAGAMTLASTMTELDVKPHRGESGGSAPAPKDWS